MNRRLNYLAMVGLRREVEIRVHNTRHRDDPACTLLRDYLVGLRQDVNNYKRAGGPSSAVADAYDREARRLIEATFEGEEKA